MQHVISAKDLQARPIATPGWPEIIAGLSVMALVGYGGGSQLYRLGLPSTSHGLVFAGLSGVAGLLGFQTAVSLRVRDVSAFGIRRTSSRWLLIAVGVGLAALVVKMAVVLATAQITHTITHVQDVYAAGGSGGTASLILATFLLAVLTPVGEEFLFRGVLTTALLRYGPLIAVGGSAVIFAVMHGVNAILPIALLEGLLAAEIFRRSGSIWTAVMVHALYNLPSVPVMVLSAHG
ncbi:MAG: CPBP family intramembrane metalloprotease [Oxalobacteraceae bacterium]|nr:MAG: CPBP family intramembrane metalloprotease [Oxalobacteraceae bacterium]